MLAVWSILTLVLCPWGSVKAGLHLMDQSLVHHSQNFWSTSLTIFTFACCVSQIILIKVLSPEIQIFSSLICSCISLWIPLKWTSIQSLYPTSIGGSILKSSTMIISQLPQRRGWMWSSLIIATKAKLTVPVDTFVFTLYFFCFHTSLKISRLLYFSLFELVLVL